MIHCCGWEGDYEGLTKEYIQGFLVSASCPVCGGDWPFLFDDDDLFYIEEPYEYEYAPKNRDLNQQSKNKRLRMWS